MTDAVDSATTAAARAQTPQGHVDADAVYFLMWPGWEAELVGNRWHFARRWSRRVPVVLVQPTLSRARASIAVEAEARIPNCELLRVRAAPGQAVAAEVALIQTAQVLDHIVLHGYERPLLWCYNPTLLGLYAALPAIARIFHATENYFRGGWFHGVGGDLFERQLRASYGISDVVIAVSNGLADAIEDEAGVHADVVTNGCDFQVYASGSPDAELAAVARRFDRVAIYAGNISNKVDFALVLMAVDAHPSTLFAFFGPVAELERHDERAWKDLIRRPNAYYGGAVPVERLPDLYAAADVGMIPYRPYPLLVENGFPLKLFEMCATGLPVVSTLMRPIVGVADGVFVADSNPSFVACLGEVSRASLSPSQREDLIRLASKNDYDRKFERIVQIVAERIPESRAPHTRIDDAVACLGAAGWQEICGQWSRHDSAKGRWPLSLAGSRRAADVLRRSVPAPLRRRIPNGIKAALRRRRTAVEETRP